MISPAWRGVTRNVTPPPFPFQNLTVRPDPEASPSPRLGRRVRQGAADVEADGALACVERFQEPLMRIDCGRIRSSRLLSNRERTPRDGQKPDAVSGQLEPIRPTDRYVRPKTAAAACQQDAECHHGHDGADE